MRYFALAADYDGTLARDGRVSQGAVDALRALREAGRSIILVTGRILEDLERACDCLDVFDLVVAENGALLYDPKHKTRTALCESPAAEFVAGLRSKGVTPLEIGHGIVATCEPHQNIVLDTIRELGLDLQVIFNKGAVMVLPAGVNKATGLQAALTQLGLSPHNVAGVGDAENDHAFLALCECSAAVANALSSLKESADLRLAADHGDGVAELAHAMLENDLANVRIRAATAIAIGNEKGEPVFLDPHLPGALLLAGSSGGGKSSIATTIVERLIAAQYQLCIVDPEGDYDALDHAVVLGDAGHAASADEIEDVLKNPTQSVVVNLLGLSIEERPTYFAALLGRLRSMRDTLGRAHWIVLDEAHHLLPHGHRVELSDAEYGIMALTVHPAMLSRELLQSVRMAVTVGDDPSGTLAQAVGEKAPQGNVRGLPKMSALLWRAERPEQTTIFEAAEPKTKRQRHRRKYATGDLAPEKSFYFRGPHDKLNLRAHNLTAFVQLSRGVDDETWQHHLRNGEIARWFKEMLDDEQLADAALRAAALAPEESRNAITSEIEKRYTAPARPSSGP